jgi:hypothetical protein
VEQVKYNIQDTKFSDYFVDIEHIRQEDLSGINLLIEKYPYCQALHLLATRSAANTSFYEKTLAHAAVSVPSRNVLYNFVHHPSKFKQERTKKAATQPSATADTLISIINDPTAVSENTAKIVLAQDEKYVHDDEVFDEITSATVPEEPTISIHHQPVFETAEIENLNLDGEKYSETLIADEPVDEPKEQVNLQEEIEEQAEETADLAAEETEEEVFTDAFPGEESKIEAFEESREEIDVKGNNGGEVNQAAVAADVILPYIENIEDDEEEKEQGNDVDLKSRNEQAVSPSAYLPQVKEPVNLSRYDDERLPYTFLWWLAKTRKTYQENLRPYATFSLDTTQEISKNENDPLEHQIAENIFHINSLSGMEDHTEGTATVAFDFMKKEHQIIEKFIKEEPQIKPPPANKIDTENKAKRSSEDSNELVSETLAKVYVEQMLFHKALEVYRKLSLKYPEKSAYFASQIKYLELKVN